jgi:hypothetical protein
MTRYIRTLTVQTDLDIYQSEIPLFRGAVIKNIGERSNILFHNHIGDNNYRYSYPLIQYKRIGGKAAIVFIEDAIDSVSDMLSSIGTHLIIGKRHAEMHIDTIESKDIPTGVNEGDLMSYKLINWLPLNSKNYHIYQESDDMIDRTNILNKILTANILSFLKGIGIFLTEKMDVFISNIYHQNLINYKDISLMAFDVEFRSNISLPSYIGLGKNASVGFGVVYNNYNK